MLLRLHDRPSGQPFRDRVDERDLSSFIGDDDGIANARQRRLEFFASANVSHDLGSADDFAFAVLQGRDGERYVDPSPILRETYCVEVIDALTAPQLLQEVLLLLVELGWDDRQDGLTDDLGLGVPEEAFRGLIPGGDPAVDPLADDRIVGVPISLQIRSPDPPGGSLTTGSAREGGWR